MGRRRKALVQKQTALDARRAEIARRAHPRTSTCGTRLSKDTSGAGAGAAAAPPVVSAAAAARALAPRSRALAPAARAGGLAADQAARPRREGHPRSAKDVNDDGSASPQKSPQRPQRPVGANAAARAPPRARPPRELSTRVRPQRPAGLRRRPTRPGRLRGAAASVRDAG